MYLNEPIDQPKRVVPFLPTRETLGRGLRCHSILIVKAILGKANSCVWYSHAPLAPYDVKHMDRVENRPLRALVNNLSKVAVVAAEGSNRLRLGYVPPERGARSHTIAEKPPVGERGDVRPYQVDFATPLPKLASVREHVLVVMQRLLEHDTPPLLQSTLHHLVDQQDGLTVEVLCVQQVLARPMQTVVLAHALRELVGSPRSQVLLHEIGGCIEQRNV
mmetsp:Transcript_4397/g.13316  ORF Transcript_4397/g.13316 Transcript_4397/m.13316 type:complete len:219 (+) Transcript_4397:356-1012(+)|eukprot:scaffold126097_cov29-Tisochrysis_lutea.AAC.1